MIADGRSGVNGRAAIIAELCKDPVSTNENDRAEGCAITDAGTNGSRSRRRTADVIRDCVVAANGNILTRRPTAFVSVVA